MAANNNNEERHVIPRWRTFREALAVGELTPAKQALNQAITGTEFIAEKEASWRENHHVPFALDLISAAIILGSTPTAREAATFILQHSDPIAPTAMTLARSLLGIQERSSNQTTQDRVGTIHGIQRLKIKRIEQPKNAFVWMDLARLYITLGQIDAARQAIDISRALAPTERFVLRSTIRFLIHIKEVDEALHLVRSSPRTPWDPWLLAAEIAVSSVVKKNPRFTKLGKELLTSASIDPFHCSELASALATLEMYNGKQKHANRLFSNSLIKPTDNALAQVIWASKKAGLGQVSAGAFALPHRNEALALNAMNLLKWEQVITESLLWAKDEPFSARPRLLSSSVAASLLDQPKLAESIAREGLITNPRHPALINNVAFAMIMAGKPADALLFLNSTHIDKNITTANAVCLSATYGLAKYRTGDTVQGSQFYEAAIKTAEASRPVAHDWKTPVQSFPPKDFRQRLLRNLKFWLQTLHAQV